MAEILLGVIIGFIICATPFLVAVLMGKITDYFSRRY